MSKKSKTIRSLRDLNLKIPDIKMFIRLTRLLGKLGINACRLENRIFGHLDLDNQYSKYVYGFGLKEAKDLVESTFDYRHILNSPLDQHKVESRLHQIKRTRQLMHTLNKLGLHTPDAGLQVCRQFVARRQR